MQRIGLGIFIGIGLASLTRAVRPIAKGALKLGLIGADALKNAFAEGKETLSDLLAEVKQEIAQGTRAGATRRGNEPGSQPRS